MVKRSDTKLILVVILLSLIGLLMVYSTGGLDYLLKQSIWLLTASIFALLFSRVNIRIWSNLSKIIYLAVVALLVVLLFSHNGYPKRWFKFSAICVQPSEFAKFSTILVLANFLAMRKRIAQSRDIIIPLIIVAIPAILITLEPDLGAAQIFFPILIVMLYWSGMSGPSLFIIFSPIISIAASFSIYLWIGYMAAMTIFLYLQRRLGDFFYGIVANSLAGLITPVIWNSLKPYQQRRILSFLSPWIDPRGMSWQSIQSKIAIGSGKLFGKGFLSGTQKKLEFLPERHTNFIFSCLGEEFGLIGIAFVIFLYVYLLYRILILSRETKNKFASLFTIGVFTWIGYQTFINIGMTMGLLPITGVPLPFISYGGSSLLAFFSAIGVCLYISKTKFY